jgi:hypothetical protein
MLTPKMVLHQQRIYTPDALMEAPIEWSKADIEQNNRSSEMEKKKGNVSAQGKCSHPRSHPLLVLAQDSTSSKSPYPRLISE